MVGTKQHYMDSPRPHKVNGDFASPDPQKREEDLTVVIPPTPTNFTPTEESYVPKTGEELITAKNILYKKFAKAIFCGANQTEAALLAGVHDGAGTTVEGSRLIRNPIVQQELKNLMGLMESKNLGVDRALGELEKGLTNGKIGSNADYLDKQLKILGMLKNPTEDTSGKNIGPNIFTQLIIESEKRGQVL